MLLCVAQPLQPVFPPARVTRLSCHSRVLPRTGGLDDTLHTIIASACEQNIPFVFALNRKALGRSLNKAVPVSVVGIFSYDGAQVSGSGCAWGEAGTACSRQPAAPQPQWPLFPESTHGSVISSSALGSLLPRRCLGCPVLGVAPSAGGTLLCGGFAGDPFFL